jgi:CDP-6-deoxy-D-xylo-4-hexulose-3-dehydrase
MELGAAFGNAQLRKLPTFKKTREQNFKKLSTFFKQFEDFFIIPEQNKLVTTQWLSFPLTIKEKAPFTRLEIVTFLEQNNIQTRPIFTGIITEQPGFKDIKYRTLLKSFPITEEVMERGFVVGCHHGMEQKHIDRLKEVFISFFEKFS